MPLSVETVRTLVPGLPVEQETLLELSETKGPLLDAPEIEAVKLTVPEKSFSALTVIVEVPEDPLPTLREVGDAVIWKSTTLTVTINE